MPTSTPRTEAVPHPGLECTNFLRHIDSHGTTWAAAPMGLNAVEHRVTVFTGESYAGLQDHAVVIKLRGQAFLLQEYLTPEEARTLAAALLMAASHAEDQDNERRAADFLASQQQQAAEVPA